MIHTRAPQGHATKNDQEGFRFVAEGGARVPPRRFRVTPADFFSLTWSLYRLQLSAMEATAAFWWTAGIELWQPRSGVAPERS
jgi:hypothetical protein